MTSTTKTVTSIKLKEKIKTILTKSYRFIYKTILYCYCWVRVQIKFITTNGRWTKTAKKIFDGTEASSKYKEQMIFVGKIMDIEREQQIKTMAYLKKKEKDATISPVIDFEERQKIERQQSE
jgi:hypothetical protein